MLSTESFGARARKGNTLLGKRFNSGRGSLRRRLGLVAILATGSMGVATSAAVAGTDSIPCASTNSFWCRGYEHHSMRVQAEYGGSGQLPLAVGSRYQGTSWVFYAESSDAGRGFNNVWACWSVTCGTNSTFLGRIWFQNRHGSTHTVNGTDFF